MRELVAACAAQNLLLIVELLTYRLDGETEEEYQAAFPGLVAEAAALGAQGHGSQAAERSRSER